MPQPAWTQNRAKQFPLRIPAQFKGRLLNEEAREKGSECHLDEEGRKPAVEWFDRVMLRSYEGTQANRLTRRHSNPPGLHSAGFASAR
jgi:hypothetical protein